MVSILDGVKAMPHDKWFDFEHTKHIGWSKVTHSNRCQRLFKVGVLQRRKIARPTGGVRVEFFFSRQVKRSEINRIRDKDKTSKDHLFDLFMRA